MMAAQDSEITPHDELAKSEESFVASGSTCVCFRVRQHGRLLFKKQLLPALASNDRSRQALEKEFEIGYHLDHPHIPRYLEFHGDYLLMEYVDGVTLTTFCERHPNYFKEKQKARQFTRELCSAVGYLHQHQVLHLDLKPDNILLTHIGNHVKLVDLGYCYQDSYPFTTGGTTHYSAPEKEKSPASDVYSLGRIFSELGIAGERVTAKCLRTEAAERYQSIDELMAAMRHPRWSWTAALFMLLILLLSGWIWWWAERKESSAMEYIPKDLQEESKERTAKEELKEKAWSNDTPSSGKISQRPEASTAVQDSVSKESKEYSDERPKASTADLVFLSKKSEGYSDERPTAAVQNSVSKESKEYSNDMLTRDQKRILPLFVSVTDSILGELRLLVANEQAPYQLGGLEAYTAAYERLKAAAMECGKYGGNVPFWMRLHWMKYNGKPKPYDLFDNYLYQQLSSIEALYQTHATNYTLYQKQTNDNPPPQ